jgi:ABC-2 type transport system permease protein
MEGHTTVNQLSPAATIGRSLAAAFRKNALEFVRYPVNMIFSLAMPVIWFIPTYFLIVSFAPDGVSAGLDAWIGESDFFAYLPVGLVVSYVIMTIFWNMGFALKRLMDIGMLETLWACPVPRTVFILGESLFSMARMLVEVVVIVAVYRFVFGFGLPAGFIRILPHFVPFLLLMYGFGIGFAALVLLVKDANTMVDTSSFLVQGLTGTQNPPQVFPRFLLAVSMAIPITYFIDFLRVRTLNITPLISPALEQLIILGASVLVPAMGLAVFAWVDRRVRITGSIHVH